MTKKPGDKSILAVKIDNREDKTMPLCAHFRVRNVK